MFTMILWVNFILHKPTAPYIPYLYATSQAHIDKGAVLDDFVPFAR